jgi:hypothetical protein
LPGFGGRDQSEWAERNEGLRHLPGSRIVFREKQADDSRETQRLAEGGESGFQGRAFQEIAAVRFEPVPEPRDPVGIVCRFRPPPRRNGGGFRAIVSAERHGDPPDQLFLFV